MSRRGRATGAAISLFSFQDIITSVTAIMILLVLILTLELVGRSRHRGVAAEDRRVARNLRAAVEAMERQADTLRAELTSLQASARRSASFSADETRRRERKAVEMARTIAEEVDVLETELRTAASTRRRAEATLITDPAARPEATAVHVAAMQARAIEMEEANLSESVRQAAAQAAGNDLAVARTLAFSRPPGGQLEPRLLEVSGQGLAVLEPGTTEPRRFPGLGRAFNRWLASLDGRTVYVVVILRPSGLDLYDRVTEAVKDVGLQMGAELVGESMTVTFAAGSGE